MNRFRPRDVQLSWSFSVMANRFRALDRNVVDERAFAWRSNRFMQQPVAVDLERAALGARCSTTARMDGHEASAFSLRMSSNCVAIPRN